MISKIISSLLAGLIAGLSALIAVAMEMPDGSEVTDIGSLTLFVIGGGAVLTAAKDLQSYLKNPRG